MFRTLAALAIATLALAPATGPTRAAQGPVKMSSSGICHCPGGDYYGKTRSFTAFGSIDACLSEGGRQPHRGQGQCSAAAAPAAGTAAVPARGSPSTAPEYDRDLFGRWQDEDSDCLNTRHELLARLSTGRITYSDDGCRVVHGRWNDPYTGRFYSESRDLDIDHMVPLAYAFSRGADKWSREKRVRFANDPVNLFPVQASANRQKGAAGPTKWLPPNRRFHCRYILRFQRIARTYRVKIPASEASRIAAIQAGSCG